MSFCKPRKNTAKRFFDLVVAVFSVIILTPVFILIGFFAVSYTHLTLPTILRV